MLPSKPDSNHQVDRGSPSLDLNLEGHLQESEVEGPEIKEVAMSQTTIPMDQDLRTQMSEDLRTKVKGNQLNLRDQSQNPRGSLNLEGSTSITTRIDSLRDPPHTDQDKTRNRLSYPKMVSWARGYSSHHCSRHLR